ncbi:MAG: NAD(P)H-dependent oxidoreductase [Opitutaceae bacterium]|nr:NAD(P)H-dependent oxidoreductase [Opitutaceae bacterium]
MRILVVIAHPNPASFNHALAASAASALRVQGHEVLVQDLYAEGFDPLMPAAEFAKDALLPPDVARRCAELTAADGLIIVHPNWWGQPPAVLKGWIDRVVRPGVAYEFRLRADGKPGPVGLLKLQTALILNTGNTPLETERAVYGDPLEGLWKKCFCGMCGIPRAERLYFTSVIVSTPDQRARWLGEAAAAATTLFPRG